jgi:phosphatidate cytidylyltransferase
MAYTAVGCVLLGPVWTYILLSIVVLIATMEWIEMTKHFKANKKLIGSLGLFMILFFGISFLSLQRKQRFALFSAVWATDIGAYIFGSVMQGPRLWTSISPKKTISGFLGGLLCTCIISNALFHVTLWQCILLSLASQFGDLVESKCKRIAHLKDSNLVDFYIPGHGGVLDRIDALIFATPIAMLIF